jgi:CHAT domain-containing protein
MYDLLTARSQISLDETKAQKSTRIAQADAELPKVAKALSRMLLGPAAELLGNKRLLIVSEGALQYIPFGALAIPNYQSPATEYRPLMTAHEIVCLPSASVLAVLRRELAERKPAAKSVAVLADPVFVKSDPRIKTIKNAKLDTTDTSNEQSALMRSAREMGMAFSRLIYSRREAEAIMKLVPSRDGKKAVDFAASRETATGADLHQYRIVHFATHGLLNSEHPELSGIVLSLVNENGKERDGFLRLHEIYNLNLPADLVVLSACQTALGKEIKGEGLIGLTRGFMYAGAARVAASLWSVGDVATAELMKSFYAKMLGREQLRPAAALRAAQVELWKSKRWTSPYYWAGFVLQGEWD